ncbi:hypothetical protein EGI20_11355 [Aquitalea sp. S1-19]|nr:hypothetical protein [Aquitalea sp. S1-19]
MTNLYVRIIERETRQFQQRVTRINRLLPALQATDALASRANGWIGMRAWADACEQGYPFINIRIPLERMPGLDVAASLTEAMGETVMACVPTKGEYIVLLDDDGDSEEGTALRVKVEVY